MDLVWFAKTLEGREKVGLRKKQTWRARR
ncbi:hypothetical protein PMIN01_06125 [Paraphaeosphaeria minitans]|uniref:Uncharacterized protein n=1 Tax=Paraphaeosphaeria minitans TaxID=565426 RepID=A0A9P6KRI9_9PLEO|nr:hypothetical protein PMIN01_06125 [Paraphaeosphaeria minitans]